MKFVLKRFPFKIDEQYLSISNPIVKIQLLKRTKCFKVILSQFLLLINIWICNCFVTSCGIIQICIILPSLITLIPVHCIYFARNVLLVFWMNISCQILKRFAILLIIVDCLRRLLQLEFYARIISNIIILSMPIRYSFI